MPSVMASKYGELVVVGNEGNRVSFLWSKV